MRSFLTFLMAGSCFLACLAQTTATDPSGTAKEPKSGLDLQNFDKSVRPQDNFFRYVNGLWLDSTEIPADKSGVSSFSLLADRNDEQIKVIIEEVSSQKAKPGSDQQRIGDLYKSYMNTEEIEKRGLSPLADEITMIKGAKSHEDIVGLMVKLRNIGVSAPVRAGVNLDGKDSSNYAVYMGQGGLGMPDRSYYLDDTEAMKSLRSDYLIYAETIFKLAGFDDAGDRAKSVLDLETRLAKDQWTRVDSRDRDKTYNKFSPEMLLSEAKGFDWKTFLTDSGFGKRDLIVTQPSYVVAFASMFKQISVENWKDYYLLRLISNFASELPSTFEDAYFQFYSVRLNGAQEMLPRWKRSVGAVNDLLGELVGKLYVKKHFLPEAKARMEELVDNLLSVFGERLDHLDWMTATTKKEAKAKLAKFNKKIGYPNKWYEYPGLEIKDNDLIGNIKRATLIDVARDLNRLGKPVYKDEWGITPQTVNAYYSPSRNEIVFPAAILQPPFFTIDADMAVNYGGIGAVIGHEITHGFDDQGRKSDGQGNLREWWSEADGQEFVKRANLMVEQYSGYKPLPDVAINGKLTLGENIADLGGLTVAYYAYKRSLKGQPAPVLDGFTGEQRVFLSWAQIWRRKYRDEALRQILATDPHSPGEFRTMGIVSNLPEFYEAFDVKEGDPVRQPEARRVKIW